MTIRPVLYRSPSDIKLSNEQQLQILHKSVKEGIKKKP